MNAHSVVGAPRAPGVCWSTRLDQDRDRALGADAFVAKPIELAELTALVQRLLGEG